MSPQRRTALASVVAAVVLVALKLGAGIESGSLGLVSEALHSLSDLAAALLTFLALGVAVRPADRGHQYGHGKAEHLAALAEAVVLVGAAAFIAWHAVERLAGRAPADVDAAWWTFVVLGVVIAIDVSRTVVSRRAARRWESPALAANAVHFGSDLLGSLAVLAGLIGAAAGRPNADSVAALFVAVLVLAAAARLARVNVDVLMDRAPGDSEAIARAAIGELGAGVGLRRLRLRQAAGRHFADVVIGVPPGSAVGQGHAAADAVEEAVQRALPGSDVVVHVEPDEEAEAAARERVLAAAASVPEVREVHNVRILTVADRTELSLHLKLPGELSLERAHAVATAVEAAVGAAVPEAAAVHTHLEPLAETGAGTAAADVAAETATIARIVREITGRDPREVRFVDTDDGLLVFLTLVLEGGTVLAEAHASASEIEERVRREQPRIADVVIHTEPKPPARKRSRR